MEAKVDAPQQAAAQVPSAPKLDDRPARRIGYLILFLSFGLFGAWAALAPLDSAALAPGTVMVRNHHKIVQHLEGGIIKALHVRDGDQVQAGDLLIELEGTQTLAEQEMLLGQLIAVSATADRLTAERDDLSSVVFSASPGGNDPRVLQAQENERRIFAARRNAHQGEIGVLRKRVAQLDEQIRGFRVMIANKQELAASHREEIGDLGALLAEGFVDKQRLREQQRSLTLVRAEIAELQSSIAQAQLQIGETELQIAQLRKKFASEVASQLADVQPQVSALSEQLSAARDRAKRIQIRAPEAGMVLGMRAHTVGGVAKPGAALLEIVPTTEGLIIETQISPVDIDRVAPGKLADIRFSAFKSATTPVIEGRLTHVSADRLVNEQTGAAYYLGHMELSAKGRQDLGNRLLVPGMPAEVLIKTGARTLLSYLLQPASNAFARALIED